MNKSRVVLIASLTLVLIGAPLIASAKLKVGIFPRRSAVITHKAFTPLASKLSQELEEEVELVLSKDFQSFWKQVKSNEFDIIHYTQYHYVKAHKELGHKLLVANEEFGNRTLTGAIFVRKDSNLKNTTDLKGKKIFFGGGKKAMGAYIAPMSILKDNSLEKGKDFTAQVVKSGPNALLALYHKQADAACAGNVVMDIKAATQKIDKNQIKILAESENFPHLPWAVRKDMSEQNKEKIKAVMLSLKSNTTGKKILEAAGVTDFFEVNDNDYDSVRRMANYVLGDEL